jgi:hypothetical protein
MSDANENGNENAPDSVLTVAEAAQQLNVTLPRLRRMLARPDFAACLLQVERQTKTGTRTSTVLPVSVLVSLQQALESGETAKRDVEAEREQEREQTQNRNENAVLLEQMRSEIQYLRGELTAQREQHGQETARRDEADGEFRRLLLKQDSEIARLQQENRLLLAVPPVESTPQSNEDARTDTVEPDAGISAQELEQAENRLETGQEKKKWYQFWRK